MKQKFVVILFSFLVGRTYLSAQVFDQSVINTLQSCIQQQQYDRADSIIKSFRGKELPETSVFWLNLIHSDVGVSKYRQSHDAKVYIPYMQSGIDAFTFLSHNINKEKASTSLDLWSFLFYWSDLFSQLDNAIIDSLSTFSNKYYFDFDQKNHALYYLAQRKIYQYYFDKQEWSKCINVMCQVENRIRDNSPAIEQIAYSRFDIGQAYMNMEDFNSAEKWYVSSYSAFSKISNKEDDETYGCLLLLLSKLYFEHVRNLDNAYRFSLEAERVNKNLFGEGSKEHIASLDFLSYSELGLGKNKVGVEHLEKEEILLNSTHDLNDSEKQSYYDKLKIAYLRLNINRNVASQDTIVTENTLLYEATNAYAQGNMKEAINKFINLVKIYDSNFQSKDIANYVYVIGSLSNALASEGYYAQADSLLDKAIATFHDYKIDSPHLIGLYMSKGLLYYTINNVDLALYWYNQAKDKYVAEGERSLQYGMLLSNLAMCQMAKENYPLAKQLSDKAYDICIQFYGDNSNNANDRLLILNNLATIYTKLKDFSKGKELYERVIEDATSQHNIGTKALALINLSEIYLLHENDFTKAEEYLRKAMKMEAASYVKDMAEMDLLLTQILQKRETAVNDVERYNNRIKEELASMYAHFSEVEREEYWTQKSQSLVFLNNLSAITFNTPHTLKVSYDNTIYTKRMLINSGRLLRQLVNDCGSDVQNEYSSMINMKRKLSNKNCPNDSIDVYREEISQKEKAIVAAIPNFSNKLMAQFKTCSDVQKMLSDNEIALEFVFLPQIKSPFDESELLYGAMLLARGDTAPKLIPLCSEYDLEDLMDAYTPMGQNEIDSLYAFSNKTLYHMIWEKLEPYIPVGSTVYYSPTGYISKINLSAVSNGNKRLSELYNLHEVSTTALIDEVKQSTGIDYQKATLYGDVNYYEDVDLMAENARMYSLYTSGEVLATRSLSRGTWDLLPGTKEEVETIAELLKSKGTNVYMLTQNDANEESFKAFDAHAPELIHIATHGFYFPPEEDVTSSFFNGLHSYTQKDYSMLYSGLLFAGSNNAWTGKEITEGVEDGILTADEISRLDLSGNKLIVLSACNTGLGDIDNVDGVFGLQRGLKRAGVKTILMSLWKVPDEETNDLMRMFYKDLLNGNTPHQSLKIAQKQLMAKGKSPYYWAGFILLD
ncbi:MAG: CHAT domain-containing protein [Prevotellaceae bacterium]|nr:CHAT domain-containing protein [Prevotellaceae bacterium]